MSRVINPDTGSKERNRLLKSIVKALRLLIAEQEPGPVSYDLAAFIALALYMVAETIDTSVTAWEKRGYWLKADRYRLEWEWCEFYAKDLQSALLADDWAAVALLMVKIGQKLGNIKLAVHDRLGTPWVGSWKILQERP